MKPLTIGQLARQTGVGIETIRYYERERLLDPPARRASGYRSYDADTIRRLRFIKRAKVLGFTLKEVRELLDLKADPDAGQAEVRRKALDKIADIEARVRDLLRMKAVLAEITAHCHGEGPLSDCPILNAIEPPDEVEAHDVCNANP